MNVLNTTKNVVIDGKNVDLKMLSSILGFDVDYTPTVTRKSVIDIPKGNRRLTDSGVGWKDLPSKTYLNKQTTGCGATFLAITNDVDYVIASPYIRLIDNKQEKHSNIIAVHGDIKNKTIEDAVARNRLLGIPIKLMTTYEGLSRLLSFDWFNPKSFKLLVDEAHDLCNFGLFRKGSVNFILDHYKDFGDYVFVTATPNKEQFIPKKLSGIEFMSLNWAEAKKTNISIQKVARNGNDFIVEKCRQYLGSEIDGNAHIFYNSVKEIIAVCKSIMALPNYKDGTIKIVCADSDLNRRNINKVGEGLFSKSLREPKLINFYTSCVFEGCDIEDQTGRTYVIVNGGRSSSKVCMTTLLPQICGRVRDSNYINDVSMLLCGNIDCVDYTRDEWLCVVADNLLKAKSTVDTFNHAKSLQNNEKILNTLRNSAIVDPYLVIDDNKDVVINESAMQAEMQRYDIIHAQYHVMSQANVDVDSEMSSLYKTNIVDDAFQPLGGVYKSVVNKIGDYRVIMRQYIDAVNSGDQTTVDFIDLHNPICKRHLSVVHQDKIKALKYRKKDVEIEYDILTRKTDMFYVVLDQLPYKEGDDVFGKDVVEVIKSVYQKCGIVEKVTSRTIHQYYDVKERFFYSEGKTKRGYKIIAKKGVSDLAKQQVFKS